MNNRNGWGRKLRHGSASIGITALVLVAVILVNVLVSVLCFNNRWFIETTGESMSKKNFPLYRLTDAARDLLGSTLDSVNANRAEDDPVQVDIIFCTDPDILYGNWQMRCIYFTALEMQKAFPESIKVSTRDVWDNPSSVDAYRTNSYSSIYQSDVIVASGSEFRVFGYRTFFVYNETGDTAPWGYSGEKKFLSGIIAVTRAEAPVCALTTNHGEPFATEEGRAEYSEFLKVIEGAGYDIAFVDLEKEELPEDCRLVITFDPQTDFVSTFGGGGVSEAKKLEKHLDLTYSYVVFFDADTPKLPVLEEFLEEWGISVERYSSTDGAGNVTLGTYEIADSEHSLDAAGNTVIGQYEPEGMGGSLTSNMRETGGSPKVIFGNAVPLSYSPTYQTTYALADAEAGTGAFIYGSYYKNNLMRDVFDVFRTGDQAIAYANVNGERLTDATGAPVISTYNKQDPYRLMTITSQTRTVGEGQGYTTVNDASYVCAVGSTEFASNAVLKERAYGNTDTLLSLLRLIGREIVPVGIKWTTLYDAEIDTEYYSQGSATVTTVFLALIPVVAFGISGLTVLVRRRTRS